jgi:translocation protein SEC72
MGEKRKQGGTRPRKFLSSNHSHSVPVWEWRQHFLLVPSMSHSHTHAPGEVHDHSHGPPQQQQQIISQPPDPALQALIDADFRPVHLTVGPPNESQVLCPKHSLEKCADCDVDFISLNRLSKLLTANPTLMCPPPPNVVSQKLSQVITTTKEEGNVRRFINFN